MSRNGDQAGPSNMMQDSNEKQEVYVLAEDIDSHTFSVQMSKIVLPKPSQYEGQSESSSDEMETNAEKLETYYGGVALPKAKILVKMNFFNEEGIEAFDTDKYDMINKLVGRKTKSTDMIMRKTEFDIVPVKVTVGTLEDKAKLVEANGQKLLYDGTITLCRPSRSKRR
jgi:hypothetical protein